MAKVEELPFVNWPEVRRVLPLQQDPTSREARKALFNQLTGPKKKTLTLDDLQKGIKNELRHEMAASMVSGIKEMTKAIKFAFKASADLAPPAKAKAKAKAKANANARVDTGVQKRHVQHQKTGEVKATVDKREFHAFLVTLTYYLECAELFEDMDNTFTDDQKLSCRECLRGKEKLAEWGLAEEMVKERFKEVDLWTPLITFAEFAEWVMEYRWESITLGLDDSDDEEVQTLAVKASMVGACDLTFADAGAESELNKMQIKDCFAKWDSDGSGGIDEEEMAQVIADLNPALTKDLVHKLFEAADSNKDGVLDYDEFVNFLFAGA